MGDTGSGKSALIRQMLMQLTEDRQTAIVYDPAREYVERFYSPERGDIILNPLDARSPYWNPGDELEGGVAGSPTAQAEARTIAESVFPDPVTTFRTPMPRRLRFRSIRTTSGSARGQRTPTARGTRRICLRALSTTMVRIDSLHPRSRARVRSVMFTMETGGGYRRRWARR